MRLKFWAIMILAAIVFCGMTCNAKADPATHEWVDVPKSAFRSVGMWISYDARSKELLMHNIRRINVKRVIITGRGTTVVSVLIDCNYNTFKEAYRSDDWIAMTPHEAPVFAAICSK